MAAPVLILILPVLLIVILIFAIVVVTRRSSRRIKSDHHHWLVRVLAAGLAAAAVIAVGIGTWRGTQAAPSFSAVRVTQPTRTPQSIPTHQNDSLEVDVGPCKLVGTVLVAREIQGRFFPLCGESQTLDWPAKASAEMVFTGEYQGADYTVTLQPSPLRRWNTGDEISILGGGMSAQVKGRSWSWSGGGQIELDRLQAQAFSHHGDMSHWEPLSVIPIATPERGLRLLIHLTRADADDALRQIPAEQWLDTVKETKLLDDSDSRVTHIALHLRTEAPGMRMLAFLGPSALLLLLAAIAGSAVFRRGRRDLAFTALLTGMVLYCGLLDFAVLQRRVHLAGDASQPEVVRITALEGMKSGTFFHTGRAVAGLRRIADDPGTTPTLRAQAKALDEGSMGKKS